jgi:iron complex outermembrane recepter protein
MSLNAGTGILVAILLVAGAGPSNAQRTPPDSLARDSATARLKAVTVTGSRAVGVVGGASATVVRPDQLRASPAPLLDQALRESPFVHVRLNSRGENEISIRGSDSRQAAVLLNGVPITLGWDHRTDPSVIPLTGSSRIVIVRGLGSLLTGPNSLGGTIEVAHDDGAGIAPGGSLSVGGGVDENSAVVTSLGAQKRLAAGSGWLSLQSGFAYRKRDGVALPDGATDPSANDGLRTNSDLKHMDGFASVRWSNGAGRGIGFNVSAFDAEKGVPPEEHIAAPRLWRYPYHKRTIASLSGNTGSFTTPLGYATIDLAGGYNDGRFKIETFTDRTYTTVDAEELGDESTWTARAAVTHTLGGRAMLKAAYTMADVWYGETLVPAPQAEYRQKMSSVGAEIEAALGSRTTIAGGLVMDRTRTPETGGRTPGQEPFDDTGWRAGLTHQLTDAFRLHASASQRSRFPALRELYSGAANRFMPNPDLKPETLLGIEAGFTLGGALGGTNSATLEVTGFNHKLDDAVVRITLPAPDRRFRRINRDRIESSGAELLAGLVFGSDASRAVTLTADALVQSISIFDVTTAGEPERHAENNPETRGSLELGVPLPWALRAFANSRYTGTQYCLNADTGNEMELDSQVETDLAGERTFRVANSGPFRALRALVSLDNVGDATVYDQCGLPQPGRTLRVMFTLR